MTHDTSALARATPASKDPASTYAAMARKLALSAAVAAALVGVRPALTPAQQAEPQAKPDAAPLPAATSPATGPADLAADEKALDALIDDLGAEDFPTRKAASDKLERAGPAIVPLLQKYVDDRNPEVAARVRKAIQSYVWMAKGAVLNEVERGSAGEGLGLRAGDVIVKIDEFDVDLHTDVAKATADGAVAHTYYVWRAGRVREVICPPGKLGIWMVNWDVAKGGNDHARGMAALAGSPPDLDEAFRRLRAARDAGMDDSWSLERLTGLASRALDGKYAAEAYAAYRTTVAGDACELSHEEVDARSGLLPFDGPHAQWLLGRYAREPFSTQQYHELEDWAARHGRNGPLLAELLAKPWPDGQAGSRSEWSYHAFARYHYFLSEHRYDDLLGVWANRPNPENRSGNRGLMAMQAAVRGGRAGEAAQLALEMLDPQTRDPLYSAEPAWCGLAAALAAGNAAAADRFLAGLEDLGPDVVANAMALRSVGAMNHPAAADRVRRWLADRPAVAKLRPVPRDADAAARAIALQQLGRVPAGMRRQPGQPVRPDGRGPDDPLFPSPMERIELARLVSDPAATAEQFVALTKDRPLDRIAPNDREWALTAVTGLLRFGRYAEVRQGVAAIRAASRARRDGNAQLISSLAYSRAEGAANFAAANKDKLAGPWKDLQGLVAVMASPGRAGAGPTWVLRYDGAVFRVDPDGTVVRPPGLPPPPAPMSIAYRHLRVNDQTVAVAFPYGRSNLEQPSDSCPDLVYYYDPADGRWVEPADYDGPIEIGDERDTERARAARLVAKAYRPLPGAFPQARGTNREYFEADWRYVGFEGDVLVYVDPTWKGAATDLSALIGQRAGRNGPARVYPMDPVTPPGVAFVPGSGDGLRLVYSECGLWAFDPKGVGPDRLRRVPLGLKDENVMVSALPTSLYGVRADGKTLVGVAPQQGGQVFAVDPSTLAVTPTEGFCGLGPDDFYARRRFRWRYQDPQPAVHATYLARLAKEAGAGGAK